MQLDITQNGGKITVYSVANEKKKETGKQYFNCRLYYIVLSPTFLQITTICTILSLTHSVLTPVQPSIEQSNFYISAVCRQYPYHYNKTGSAVPHTYIDAD